MNHSPFMHPFGGYMMMNYSAHPVFLGLIGIAAIWTLIWKGFALWRSARNHQKIWFIVMLVVNTLGILEILYLLFFSKNKNNTVTTTTVTHTTVASTPAAPAPEQSSAPVAE